MFATYLFRPLSLHPLPALRSSAIYYTCTVRRTCGCMGWPPAGPNRHEPNLPLLVSCPTTPTHLSGYCLANTPAGGHRMPGEPTSEHSRAQGFVFKRREALDIAREHHENMEHSYHWHRPHG
eukprot:scaffold36204_cov146-Isochrysis_galbana.AAC.1